MKKNGLKTAPRPPASARQTAAKFSKPAAKLSRKTSPRHENKIANKSAKKTAGNSANKSAHKSAKKIANKSANKSANIISKKIPKKDLTQTTAPLMAVIDIGSNAVRMLAGARDGGVFVCHLFTRVPLALGRETYGADKRVPAAAQQKLTAALRGLQNIAEAIGVLQCRAIATAALRDCGNRREVLANIRRRAGITIQILSGEEEAALAGAFAARQFSTVAVLNADAGGGSTDCAVIARGKLAARATFQLGTTRKNGGAAAEKNKMAAWLKRHCGDNITAAASGGSARKLAEACGEITATNLKKFIRRAEPMNETMLAETFKLTPDRARNIVMAAHLHLLILQNSGAKKMQTINGGLGQAVLMEMLEGK